MKFDNFDFTKLLQEAKIFTHIGVIADKLNNDKYLLKFKELTNEINYSEIDFALQEYQKLKTSSTKKDIFAYLTNNTYIFKENLKILFGLISSLNSRPELERTYEVPSAY